MKPNGEDKERGGDEFDLNRVLWDPEYRRQVIRRLNRNGTANDNPERAAPPAPPGRSDDDA